MKFWGNYQKGLHRLAAQGWPPGASVEAVTLRGYEVL